MRCLDSCLDNAIRKIENVIEEAKENGSDFTVKYDVSHPNARIQERAEIYLRSLVSHYTSDVVWRGPRTHEGKDDESVSCCLEEVRGVFGDSVFDKDHFRGWDDIYFSMGYGDKARSYKNPFQKIVHDICVSNSG